jgi:hypothetical protein
MVAARTPAKGLSTLDLEQIRDTLGAGRKPKVMFTEAAGQIAGQIGQVVQLTDPELSEEWILVRFGKDELPFSPSDLVIAPKVPPTRRANQVPSPREETSVPASPATSTVDTPDAPPGPPLLPDPPAPAPEPKADTAEPKQDGDAAPAKKTAAKKAAPKAKAPAGLTVTLQYGDGEWTVAANQGTKALARPYVIKPAEALKMVGMLDVPGVQEAVEEIVNAARAEAEQQAERLRSELAEIEARLAELRDTD